MRVDIMGLRDAFRSLRGGTDPTAEVEISDGEAPEPTWFQVRTDGFYEAPLDPSADLMSVRLQFLPGGKVSELNGTRSADAQLISGQRQEHQDPRLGDYTAAGRFNVQRRFERIVSYAALELTPDGFLARRIDTADRQTLELQFIFRHDSADRL